MLHVVHSLVPDLWVQAHRKCQQVWIFHCSVLPVPQCAVSCSLPTCCFVAGKVRNLINKVRSRVGRAWPPGLLIPPDIRVLMNVLSWSREYCRKLSPPASPAFELPRLPDVTFPGERSDSCRSAGGSREHPACTAAWGVWPVQPCHPPAPFGCCHSPRSHPTLPKESSVSFYFRVFWVRIILILFCLHNPDCYHPTNYSHFPSDSKWER